jgi:hypothetical protein
METELRRPPRALPPSSFLHAAERWAPRACLRTPRCPRSPPLHLLQVREAVNDFYNSRYASCLAYLERMKPDLRLDLHLHDHVEQLYTDVRSKALVQYFSPFATVDMRLMASAFNVSVEALEKELAALIMAKQISARIDSQNKVLHARQAEQRAQTFSAALKMGEDYVRETKALLLRINLMRADFVVKGNDESSYGPSKSSRGEGHRGGTPGFQQHSNAELMEGM